MFCVVLMLSGPQSAGGEGESSPSQSWLCCGPPGRPGQSVERDSFLSVLLFVRQVIKAGVAFNEQRPGFPHSDTATSNSRYFTFLPLNYIIC